VYKHWKNRVQPVDTVFFTTTVLDFAKSEPPPP
jgi:hypothetical protein